MQTAGPGPYSTMSGMMAPEGMGGFASQTEQNAAGIVSGIANVSTAGLGLAGSLYAYQRGLDPLSMAMRGFTGGGRLGAGLAGRVLGGAALGLGTAGVGLAAQQALQWTAGRMVEGQREFLATRSMMTQLPGFGQFGQQSILGYSNPMQSLAADPTQVMNMNRQMHSIGSGYGASPGQMRNITSALGSMGAIDTRSVDAVSSSVRRAMGELSNIAKTIGGDIDEALSVYQNLRSMGFTDRVQRARALTQQTGVSGMSGLSLSQVNQFATGSMQAAQQMGMSGQLGFQQGIQNLSTSSMRMAQGMTNQGYLNRLAPGGSVQDQIMAHAARMQEIQLNLGQSQGGMAMISQMFTPSGLMRGRGRDRAFAGERSRLSYRNLDRMDPYAMSDMQEQFQQMSRGLVLSRIDRIRREAGGDTLEAHRNQFEFLQQMGIGDPQEQLEYLQQLRSQPRAQFMRTAQSLQNQQVMGRQGPEQIQPLSFDRVVNDFRRRANQAMEEAFGNLGDNVEQLGAVLQSRVERTLQRAGQDVGGRVRNLGTGIVSAESMDLAAERIRRGDFSFNRYDTFAEFRQNGFVSQGAREAFLNSPEITGNLGRATSGLGRIARGLGIGSRTRGFGTRSMAEDYSFLFGMPVNEARVDPFTNVATRTGGVRQLSEGEAMQAVAFEMGRVYDPESGRMVTADETQISRMSRRLDSNRMAQIMAETVNPDVVGQYMENRANYVQDRRRGFELALSGGRSNRLARIAGSALGGLQDIGDVALGVFRSREATTDGMRRNRDVGRFSLGLSFSSMARRLQGRAGENRPAGLSDFSAEDVLENRSGILDAFARELGAESFADLSAEDAAALMASIQRSGVEGGEQLTGGADFTREGATEEQILSQIAGMTAREMLVGTGVDRIGAGERLLGTRGSTSSTNIATLNRRQLRSIIGDSGAATVQELLRAGTGAEFLNEEQMAQLGITRQGRDYFVSDVRLAEINEQMSTRQRNRAENANRDRQRYLTEQGRATQTAIDRLDIIQGEGTDRLVAELFGTDIDDTMTRRLGLAYSRGGLAQGMGGSALLDVLTGEDAVEGVESTIQALQGYMEVGVQRLMEGGLVDQASAEAQMQAEIEQMIAQAPEGQRDRLRQAMNQARERGPSGRSDELISSMAESVSAMVRMGGLEQNMSELVDAEEQTRRQENLSFIGVRRTQAREQMGALAELSFGEVSTAMGLAGLDTDLIQRAGAEGVGSRGAALFSGLNIEALQTRLNELEDSSARVVNPVTGEEMSMEERRAIATQLRRAQTLAQSYQQGRDPLEVLREEATAIGFGEEDARNEAIVRSEALGIDMSRTRFLSEMVNGTVDFDRLNLNTQQQDWLRELATSAGVANPGRSDMGSLLADIRTSEHARDSIVEIADRDIISGMGQVEDEARRNRQENTQQQMSEFFGRVNKAFRNGNAFGVVIDNFDMTAGVGGSPPDDNP